MILDVLGHWWVTALVASSVVHLVWRAIRQRRALADFIAVARVGNVRDRTYYRGVTIARVAQRIIVIPTDAFFLGWGLLVLSDALAASWATTLFGWGFLVVYNVQLVCEFAIAIWDRHVEQVDEVEPPVSTR